MPPARIDLPQRGKSARMSSANCSGVLSTGSMPRLERRCAAFLSPMVQTMVTGGKFGVREPSVRELPCPARQIARSRTLHLPQLRISLNRTRVRRQYCLPDKQQLSNMWAIRIDGSTRIRDTHEHIVQIKSYHGQDRKRIAAGSRPQNCPADSGEC